jgi:hypothetical protein
MLFSLGLNLAVRRVLIVGREIARNFFVLVSGVKLSGGFYGN